MSIPIFSQRAAKQFQAGADVWFDGTVESVDRRLADCRHLMHAVKTAVADRGPTPSYLAAIVDLETAQGHLQGLRHDLVTAAADRHESWGDPYRLDAEELFMAEPRNAREPEKARQESDDHHAALQPTDRRWVDLQAASFARDHQTSLDELKIRAANYAQERTGILPRRRSEAITAAFVAKVASLHRPPPRTASVPVFQDFPDEMMHL